jgi:3-oxoacyl-[acyl-carrier-protein] synthase-1
MTMATPRTPVHLSALGLVSALGRGKAAVARGLFAGDTSGLVLEEGWLPGKTSRVGRVAGDLPEVPAALAWDDSRNTRLILAALEEIRDEVEAELARHGPSRIGVVLGTSTSGIEAAERAMVTHGATGALPPWFHYQCQEMGRPALFLAQALGLTGPAFTVSTACTSSGKALAAARNLLRLGLCDAVITGGADSLCRLTLNGFAALEASTDGLCQPMSRNRAGINIGEAAVLFILRREPAELELLGVGESSDAYHLSAPDPSGRGAEAALRLALADAGLEPGTVEGYLNLHGTGTPLNDEMESQAVARVLPQLPCSGTKPLTGHTLGASAALELALAWLTLHPGYNPEGLLPPHRWDGQADPALPVLNLVQDGARLAPGGVCLSNSFAFGGNNLALVAGRTR